MLRGEGGRENGLLASMGLFVRLRSLPDFVALPRPSQRLPGGGGGGGVILQIEAKLSSIVQFLARPGQ